MTRHLLTRCGSWWITPVADLRTVIVLARSVVSRRRSMTVKRPLDAAGSSVRPLHLYNHVKLTPSSR